MRIRELRQARGMTGAALARACGVSDVAVCNWEYNRIRPSAEKLPTIAAVLECEVSELYSEDELRAASEAASERVRRKAAADAKKLSEEGEKCQEST